MSHPPCAGVLVGLLLSRDRVTVITCSAWAVAALMSRASVIITMNLADISDPSLEPSNQGNVPNQNSPP
jgi:hypothetical protein